MKKQNKKQSFQNVGKLYLLIFQVFSLFSSYVSVTIKISSYKLTEFYLQFQITHYKSYLLKLYF